jgi:hypothetical protein
VHKGRKRRQGAENVPARQQEEEPEWKKLQREKKEANKKKNKALDGLDFDSEAGLEDLFGSDEGDSRRAGKKGKKGGKKGKKAEKAGAAAVDAVDGEEAGDTSTVESASDESLEQKIKKSRPPGSRVRIETGTQPGYVSVRLDKVNVIFKNQQVRLVPIQGPALLFSFGTLRLEL